MIHPRDRSVTVYRAVRDQEVLPGVARIEGEGAVEGFALDLDPV